MYSLRGIDKFGRIRDDMENDEAENFTTALTIRLQVNDDLEPNWYLYKGTEDTLIPISASDRENVDFSIFLIIQIGNFLCHVVILYILI